MPTHRSVTISLQSQYDAHTIPETLSPSSRNLLPIANRIITANIPTYPASQFWISYQCPLPPPAKPAGDETRFYYFKLFVGGRCVLSWGVSEEESWQGKVVCGFWDAGTDFEGKRVVEKRGLFFPKDEEGMGGFEVRLFRAKARRREEVKHEAFREAESGLKLTATGRKKKGERQSFYTYALVDPKDAPFVTFRYVFKTKEQLRKLELQDSEDEEGEEAVVASPRKPATLEVGLSEPPSPCSSIKVNSRTRRLSIPPRTALQPGKSGQSGNSPSKPPSPLKKAALHNEAIDGQVRVSVDEAGSPHISSRTGVLRTPSPPSGSRHGFNVSPGTPPSQRKAASNGLFKSVVASALKRKGDRLK